MTQRCYMSSSGMYVVGGGGTTTESSIKLSTENVIFVVNDIDIKKSYYALA